MREPIFSRSKMFGRLAFSEPTGKASICTAWTFAATTFSEASTITTPISNPSSRTSFPPSQAAFFKIQTASGEVAWAHRHRNSWQFSPKPGYQHQFGSVRTNLIRGEPSKTPALEVNLSPPGGRKVEASFLPARNIASSSEFCQAPNLAALRFPGNPQLLSS